MNVAFFGNRVFATDWIKLGLLRWARTPFDGCRVKRGTLDTDRPTQREDDVKTQGKDSHRQANKLPRLQTLEERPRQTLPLSPQREPTVLTPWSCTRSLQNTETRHVCGLSHPRGDTLLWQPQETNIPFLMRGSQTKKEWDILMPGTAWFSSSVSLFYLFNGMRMITVED